MKPIKMPLFTLFLCFFSLSLQAGLTEQALADLLHSRYSHVAQPGEGDRGDEPYLLAMAVTQFYAQRQYQPVWDTPRLNALLLELDRLKGDGLNPEDYHLSRLVALDNKLNRETGALPGRSVQVEAERDVLATEGLMRAMRHLEWGKTDPRRINPHWNFPSDKLSQQVRLTQLTQAIEGGDLEHSLQALRPTHPIYHQLQAAFATLLTQAQQGGWRHIPEGETLKPGMQGERVLALRERLAVSNLTLLEAAEPGLFDEGLAQAVSQFQEDQYLDVDGAVGRQTLAALNHSVSDRIAQVQVNLERARWLLHDVPETFVLVDIAGFKASYFERDQRRWSARIQVGKPFRTTPEFRSEITRITLNPDWTVPPTIYKEDILPRLKSDLSYLASNRIRVLDGHGKELDPTLIDWTRPGNVILRQSAGPRSALGRAAIRFPNPFFVYLHDTPHQELFRKQQRAFSSGCIRVENVMALVEILLADTPPWSLERITQQIEDGKTLNVMLKKPVPILMAYWTVEFDADGTFYFKPDIYERDGQLYAMLQEPVLPRHP